MKENKRRILEAGHYYKSKGPTVNSVMGWKILQQIRHDGDRTMLFIDDIHSIGDLHQNERNLEVVYNFKPQADYEIMESAVNELALEVLDKLKNLTRRKKAKQRNGSNQWFCSGFPVTNGRGNPLCILLDAGLTVKKQQLGFNNGVNILPCYYEEQQSRLLKIVKKGLPDFNLQVILFDESSHHWEININK